MYTYMYTYMFMYMQVHVCVRVCKYMYVEAKGRPQVLFLGYHSPCLYVCLFVKESLSGLELTKSSKLACWQPQRICSLLLLQCWDHKCAPTDMVAYAFNLNIQEAETERSL